ncbi:MAG: hypothetical protein LBV04_05645 [Deferribacteraceae bacterium]|nr:hypothetical protein [Deferribacteraceae bacterium]
MREPLHVDKGVNCDYLYPIAGVDASHIASRTVDTWSELISYADEPVTGVVCAVRSSDDGQATVTLAVTYKNGVRNGASVGYALDGTLTSNVWYQNGKKEGSAQYYHPNGNSHIETTYKDGLIHGTYNMYSERREALLHPCGVGICHEISYKNGLIDGIYRLFNDGFLAGEDVYKNNQLYGESKSWRLSSNKPMSYEDGVLILPNPPDWERSLSSIKHFVADVREGYFRKYDEDGALIYEIFFINNMPVSGRCYFSKEVSTARKGKVMRTWDLEELWDGDKIEDFDNCDSYF